MPHWMVAGNGIASPITDWPMFWVQAALGLVTLAVAGVSAYAAMKATKTAEAANDLSSNMLALETSREEAIAAKEQQDQASRIWVSMIVISVQGANGQGGLEQGVLQVRNNSDRPVKNMRIASRGWSANKRTWYNKELCVVPVVFPGDTVIRSRETMTDWDIPKTYFPYFSGNYHHAVGPKGDPYYVVSVEFDDADGKSWKLDNGHTLSRFEKSVREASLKH